MSPYPITTFVAAIPFTIVPELIASLAFVWLSAWLLTFLLTRDGWQRLFLIPSAGFIVAARAAQWSPLFAAVFLQPELGWLLAVKPNIGTAIAIGAWSRRLFILAAAGGLILCGIGFLLLPEWAAYWWANVRGVTHLVVPVARPGGFLVLLALLRWRYPDARLLVALACMPQTGSWYESFPVLLVAKSRRECQLLSMISSIGFIAASHLVTKHYEFQINQDMSTFIVWFVYLPALAIVLRRRKSTDISRQMPS